MNPALSVIADPSGAADGFVAALGIGSSLGGGGGGCSLSTSELELLDRADWLLLVLLLAGLGLVRRRQQN